MRRLDVGEAVGEREGELLRGGRAGLADVVAGDGHRVPVRDLARAELDHVHAQPHGRLGREDPFLLRDVLLEDVGLDRPAKPVPADPLLLADADVEREEHRGGRVDRHRGGDLVERDAREELLHVGERVDGDALAPDLAERLRMVGVVAHQGGHVERGREPGLPVLEEVAEADVRLLGRAEAGELPHRPELAPVHGRVDAARVGEDARVAEVTLVVGGDGVGRVERLDREARHRREERVPLGGGLVEVATPGFGAVETRAVLGRGHVRRILRADRGVVRQPSSSSRD